MRSLLILLIFLLGSLNAKAQYAWDSVAGGTNGRVTVLAADTVSNVLYIGGVFNYANGITSESVAKWDNSQYYPLSCGTEFIGTPVDGIVFNGDFICGGYNGCMVTPSACGGVTTFTKMRYRPGIDAWDSLGTTWGQSVYSIATYQGKLVFGGEITYVNNDATQDANCITIWNDTIWKILGPIGSAGISWTPPPSPLWVWDAIEFNNELFISGIFNHAGGVALTIPYVARWNGITWNSAGTNSVSSFGYFGIYNNELYLGIHAGNQIYKWDGTNWNLFATLNGSGINAMIEWKGRLVVTGSFSGINNVSAKNIATWDGVQWSQLGSGLDCLNGVSCGIGLAEGYSLASYNGDLYVGGEFDHAGGILTKFIARWRQTSAIDEALKNQIKIKPNPTSDFLTIDHPELFPSYEIYSIQGDKLISSETYPIDVRSLSEGIYILKLHTTNELSVCKKFILNR